MPYRDYQRDLAPPPLRGRSGTALLETLGYAKDIALDSMTQAMCVGLPGLCPPDALLRHGDERLLDRYPADTDATYRARLLAAFDLWGQAGTARAVVAAFTAMGFVDADGAATTRVWAVTKAAPPWWASTYPTDAWPLGGTSNWSRFVVELNAPGPFAWLRRAWTDGWKYRDGRTWGSSATRAEVQLARRVIATWKAAHEVCAWIVVRFPGGRCVRWPGEE